MNRRNLSSATILLLTIIAIGCKKFITVEKPPNSVTNEYVFSNESNATSAVLALYAKAMESSKAISGGFNGLSAIMGVASDELTNYSTGAALREVSTASLLATNAIVRVRWTELYKTIYDANAIIAGLQNSTALQGAISKSLAGEAKFIRAFCYFYLVNLYGDVPLLLGTDYRLNSVAGRANKADLFKQIIGDLIEAQSSLSEDYISATNLPGKERGRPNSFAATALLARLYLYTGDWVNAEKAASRIIDNKGLYDTVPLASVFMANSKEAILQFLPVQPSVNTFDGQYFILTTAPSPSAILQNTALSQGLMESFEPGDKRKDIWTSYIVSSGKTYFFPFKYKISLANQPLSEYAMIIRLAEMYLIRAEARIRQDNISLGVADLNILRRRARDVATVSVPDPLPDLAETVTKNDALLLVENERRHELFTEWGDRWFDLKRTKRIDEVLGPVKGNTWQSTDSLWPIPLSEMLLNPNLTPQNLGYD